MSGAQDISVSKENSASGPTLSWALRRAALGVAILMVTVTAAACLLYAGIEPDRAEASSEIAGQASPLPTGSLRATGH
ncbi:MAG: hypothetical protein AB7U75_11445 [Hyphomicrobiaceae bacterium]